MTRDYLGDSHPIWNFLLIPEPRTKCPLSISFRYRTVAIRILRVMGGLSGNCDPPIGRHASGVSITRFTALLRHGWVYVHANLDFSANFTRRLVGERKVTITCLSRPCYHIRTDSTAQLVPRRNTLCRRSDSSLDPVRPFEMIFESLRLSAWRRDLPRF